MIRRLSTIFLSLTFATSSFAQSDTLSFFPNLSELWKKTVTSFEENNVFQNLDVSVTGSSTGIGVEVSSKIGNSLNLRAGFDVMPSFEKIVNFGVRVGDKLPGQTEEEYAIASQGKFQKLSELLTSLTGQNVEDNVDMVGEPSFHNFKMLLDIMPLTDKRWHATVGFYWGNSNIAKAYNTTEDMPTLFSVRMYNSMYEKLSGDDYLDYFLDNPLFGNFYLDPSMAIALAEKFGNYGRMGMHIGDYSHDIYNESGEKIHSAGDSYIMEPDADCMVKAKIKTNSFKPYLGVGYSTDSAKSKSAWGVSFDAGLLFWGGSPSLVAHDGTDLVNDLTNVRGKVGRYVDLIKGFKVYPVLQLKVTKRIF